MDTPLFPDKSRKPTDAALADLLGRTKTHWDKLISSTLAADPAAEPEWKYYTKKTGWTFLIRGKRRNILYIKPLSRRFAVSFAFKDAAVQAVEEGSFPRDLVKRLKESPRYPEGRGITVEVKTAADLKAVQKLLAIKVAQ